MKKRMLLVAWLGCIAISAPAKRPNADKISKEEWNFDGCHFMMTDLYGGRTTRPEGASYIASINPNARHPFETWIQFDCRSPVTAQIYLNDASIKLTSKGWVLDTSKEDPDFPNPHTTLYLIHGKGWEGAGTTQDDTDGDERQRTRSFQFCIPHKQLALCGSVQNVAYLMWPKETTLPQVIKLLESIEFIDPPASNNSSTHDQQ